MQNRELPIIQSATVPQHILDEVNATRKDGRVVKEMRFSFAPGTVVTDEMIREAALDFENVVKNAKPIRWEDYD